ncbi:MAG TPA: hypothetical protein VM842_05030, partial [Nitrospira sp.]|nr:hypothetical protein [Nitrospira sp.]
MASVSWHRCTVSAGLLAAWFGFCVPGHEALAGTAPLRARPMPVNTIGDLQTQVRTTAAKVIPAVVSI